MLRLWQSSVDANRIGFRVDCLTGLVSGGCKFPLLYCLNCSLIEVIFNSLNDFQIVYMSCAIYPEMQDDRALQSHAHAIREDIGV